jgi:Phage protein (N4 Gp49/phage Sf6 gene 66) family
MTTETVDQAHERLGHTAPRISPADIDRNIAWEFYLNGAEAVAAAYPIPEGGTRMQPAALSLLTICVLVTLNGFTVIGHSAPASPENFNADLGKRFARENAVRQLWPLMGYNLRQQLHDVEVLGSRGIVPDAPVPKLTQEAFDAMSDEDHGKAGHIFSGARDRWESAADGLAESGK